LAGITDVGIVVGYERDQIIDHVRSTYPDFSKRISFIDNPVFAATNNIYSLWLASPWIAGAGFVCLNADVIFDPDILVPALQARAPISMIVDPEWRDETMKVILSGDRVVHMSKKIPREAFSGTYIGITVFSAAVNRLFFERLDRLVEAGRVNEFFNVAVQELADEGIQVGFTSAADLPWAEIDDPGDLLFAQENVFPKLAFSA
jgi:choline kinase